MRVVRVLLPFLVSALVAAGSSAPSAPAAASVVPTLVGIRAAHHPGYDRIVFDFKGGLPAKRRAAYVSELVGDASGLPVRIAGRAILRVSFDQARAHNASGTSTAPARIAFRLPNIMTAVRSGDFEAVTSYGVGLAKRTTFHMFTLRNPYRVVVDIRAAFSTVNRKVYFLDANRFAANTPPFFVARLRPVRPGTAATGVMDRLFAGPLPGERSSGLRLVRSRATSFKNLSIANRIARVQLVGGCSSGGSTVTIAGEIKPTLRQFASVDWVKIYGPGGHTEFPNGNRDSIPTCLEP